jgi:uncharacterized protein (DUF427 family)
MAQALEDRIIHSGDSAPSGHRIRFEDSPKRVRVVLGGVAVADSKRVKLLFETGHLPVYYFPIDDVRMDLLECTDKSTHCPYKGDALYWTVRVGDRTAENAVWGYRDPIPERADIKGYVAFYWNPMDAWYEEDEEVFVHPRDPYKRIDVLHSSSHIRVVLAGEIVADTHRPRLLFETGLPTRYYIPKLDVRIELLEPTDKTTRCPYKGVASYWSVKIGDQVFKDIVWSYPTAVPECPKIENLLCFFNERADMYVDGELMERPKTHWS